MSDAGKAAGVMFLTVCGAAAGMVFGLLAVFPVAEAADRVGLAPEGPDALGMICWLIILCPVAGLLIGGVGTGLIASRLAGGTRGGRGDAPRQPPPCQTGDMGEP